MSDAPLMITAKGLAFAQRLVDAAGAISNELGLSGAEYMQGVTVVTALAISLNAKPGHELVAVATAADAISRIVEGRLRRAAHG